MKRTLLILVAACGTNQTPQPEPVPTLPTCVPNRDGMITPDELPIALGASVEYYVGANRTITQSGTSWDFAAELADDQVVELGPAPLSDQWYAASFPAGQFVVDAGSGLDGVYHQDAQALWLDGVASHVEMPPSGKTLIVYSPPLTTLRFPVVEGQFIFTSSATGGPSPGFGPATINGLPFQGTDELTVDVVASGKLSVPYVSFSPVLRVRTQAVRKPDAVGVPSVSRRTTIFLFECFGEITRAESKPDETNPDFTGAAYLRRFALGATP